MIFIAYGQASTDFTAFFIISIWMPVVFLPLGLIAGVCYVTMAEAEKAVYILQNIIVYRFDHFGDDVISF